MTFLPPLELEKTAMDLIASHSSEALIHFSGQVSALGSKLFIAFLVIGLWQLKKRETSVELAVSALIANLATTLLKVIIERPRPETTVYTLTHSFPSGHAATAFAAAATLSLRYPKLRYLFFVIASLVGLSRVVLQAHYPLDVLFGAAVGLASAYLTERYVETSDIFKT
ncbi:MAG: phosphatase PAP2 family protein [Candidatus Nanohalobium sp.]